MFGGTNQFSFGSAPSASPFGTTATSTAPTPATSGFLFGSTPTPAPSATSATSLNSTFTFGAPTATAAAPASNTAQPFSFGSGLTNTSTIRPFGATSVFGSTSTSTTPATNTTGFGGTSLFGATAPTTQTTSIFGSNPTTTFGAPQTTTTTPNVFGSAVPTTSQIGTTVKFEPVTGQDTMRAKNNTFQTINTKIQCIAAMKEYLSKSMEELRMEDYQANRKFPTASSLFGGTNFSTASTFSSPFGATSTFAAAPTSTTTTSIFGAPASTTSSPFGATTTTAAPFAFGGAAQTQATSIFGTNTTTTASPFGTATSTAPATTSIFGVTQPSTSIFGSTAAPSNPFGAKPAVTQTGFGFGTTTTTSSPFSFGSQPSTTTSIFSQTTASPFGAASTTTTPSIFGTATSTAPTATTFPSPFGTQPAATTNIFGTSTSAAPSIFGNTTTTTGFPTFGSTGAPTSTSNIFGNPATSMTTVTPGFAAPASTSTTAPFSFNTTSTAPSIFGSTSTNTTGTGFFNTQPLTGFGTTQTQASSTAGMPSFNLSNFGSTATTANPFGSLSTTMQPQAQQANIVNSAVVLNQQQFLAASLMNPFASRGQKTFTDFDQKKPSTDILVVTSSATTTNTSTTTTTASIPVTLPIQSSSKKYAGGRPLVDIRFRLQPVSPASPAASVTEDPKSPIQTSTNAPIKSPLMSQFSEEEESALIGKNKLTKLRLSNDTFDVRPLDTSRSLYPSRSRAEIEKSLNLNSNMNFMAPTITNPSTASSTTIDTVPAYRSTTNINNEQTLHPSSTNRPIIPIHHSTPIIAHKQPSPPVSHESTTLVQSPTSPPPPSTTPPLPASSSTSSIRNKNPLENTIMKITDTTISTTNSNANAHRLPILERPFYYMEPSTDELSSKFTNDGKCFVKNFTVGHEKYGSVTFYGKIDVAGLNLDEIIIIDRHEATVYPDDDNKPPPGSELNIPARITLLGVYPTDRTTRQEMRDVERIKAMHYSEYLAEITKKFDGEFVEYNPIGGCWTFTVQHFTRYGLDGNDDDFVVAKPPPKNISSSSSVASAAINTVTGMATQKVPPKQTTTASIKNVNSNFLDQTIALNDTYAVPLSTDLQTMDTEEKENSPTVNGGQQNLRFQNRSLLSLSPVQVAQLAESMFADDDDDENDFNHFLTIDNPTSTSTKIIPSNQLLTNNNPVLTIPPKRFGLIPDAMEDDQVNKPLVFKSEKKSEKNRVHLTLPKPISNVRGKYFRTNFSGDIRFVSVDALNETRLLIRSSMSFTNETLDGLENFFSMYYNGCIQIKDRAGDIPHIEVHQNPDVVKRFIEFYSKIRDEKNIEENNSLTSLTDYSLQILELCRLLWSPVEKERNIHLVNSVYFEQQKRRQMLSDWLEQCILSQPNSEQWVKQNCELLSRGLFDECVQFAQDEGELRLAALVHSASGSDNVRDLLSHCAHEDILDLYSKDFQRTIAMLSGEFIVKEKNYVDPKRMISWQMAFALHLWFAHLSSDSISTIVNDFEQGFLQQLWLEPTTHYGNKKVFDLRWKILKFYADHTYQVENLFDVQSYTANSFDFRLSWMLYIVLRSLGTPVLSNENDTFLHINFAHQLENLGLWRLSIFVVLHINDRTNRQKAIDQILQRHVTSETILTEEEQCLIDKFNLPENQILLAKAQRAEYEHKWTDSVHLWIKARQWQRAHETYCRFVFHETILQGNYQYAKDVLDALDHQRANIYHWNRRGGFARQYVELLSTFDKIHHGQISLNDRFQTNLLSQVHRLREQLDDVIVDGTFKKISIADICRRLLSVLNYARLCAHIKDLNIDNDDNLTKKSNLFHQSVVASVPCSLPVDVLAKQLKLQLPTNPL